VHKATSIVLAALLIILPVEQVLAQAAQQEGVGVDRAAPPGAAASLFRVPPLTENAALLLGASSDRALLNPPFAEPSLSNADAVAGWDDWSNGQRALAVLGLIVALAIGFFILLSKAECTSPSCFELMKQ